MEEAEGVDFCRKTSLLAMAVQLYTGTHKDWDYAHKITRSDQSKPRQDEGGLWSSPLAERAIGS